MPVTGVLCRVAGMVLVSWPSLAFGLTLPAFIELLSFMGTDSEITVEVDDSGDDSTGPEERDGQRGLHTYAVFEGARSGELEGCIRMQPCRGMPSGACER